MEFVATADQQLRHLGHHDPDLAPYFAGVFPSHRLPTHPVEDRSHGNIVNIDTHDQLGSHGSPSGRTIRHVRSSTVLPFRVTHVRGACPVTVIDGSFRGVREQSLRHSSCGELIVWSIRSHVFGHMSVGGTLDTFPDIFSRHDFAKNDLQVANGSNI